MTKTFTSKQKANYLSEKPENMSYEIIEESELMFYNNIKQQLDQLSKNPSDETIMKILAYSKKK
jgi:acyl-CoA-binding protein